MNVVGLNPTQDIYLCNIRIIVLSLGVSVSIICMFMKYPEMQDLTSEVGVV